MARQDNHDILIAYGTEENQLSFALQDFERVLRSTFSSPRGTISIGTTIATFSYENKVTISWTGSSVTANRVWTPNDVVQVTRAISQWAAERPYSHQIYSIASTIHFRHYSGLTMSLTVRRDHAGKEFNIYGPVDKYIAGWPLLNDPLLITAFRAVLTKFKRAIESLPQGQPFAKGSITNVYSDNLVVQMEIYPDQNLPNLLPGELVGMTGSMVPRALRQVGCRSTIMRIYARRGKSFVVVGHIEITQTTIVGIPDKLPELSNSSSPVEIPRNFTIS